MTLEQIIQIALIGTNIDIVRIKPIRTCYNGKIMRPMISIWRTKSPNRTMRLGKFLYKYAQLTQAEIQAIVEDYKRGIIKDYPSV